MIIFEILILLGLVAIFILLLLRREKKKDEIPQYAGLMQQQIDNLRREMAESLSNNISLINQQLGQINSSVQQQLSTVNQQLQNTTGQIGVRLSETAKVLGELSSSSKQIYDVGKDISTLQEILRAPKTRGLLGEFLLKDILSQILPVANYDFQYQFKQGKVDAVVRLANKLIPIDAKFPLENFQKMVESPNEEERKRKRRDFFKDIKKHIDDISSKYIVPDEGTYDFAMMYIPAENVYYEILTQDQGEEQSIHNYALGKRVIPVSPNSFYAYLQAIAFGLQGLKIEKQAAEILGLLKRLAQDYERFYEDFETLGRHILNARAKYEEAEKKLLRFEDKLSLSQEIPAPTNQ